MPEIRVGDRVRVTDGDAANRGYHAAVETGREGVVTNHLRDDDTCPFRVLFGEDSWYMSSKHLELVTDSEPRMVFEGGGMREPQDGKPRFDLLFPVGVPYEEQFLTRFAVHMAKGAAKYEDRNWEKFSDKEALERAKASALRHIMQWLSGETDEDHAAAVVFNLMAAEHVKRKMENR